MSKELNKVIYKTNALEVQVDMEDSKDILALMSMVLGNPSNECKPAHTPAVKPQETNVSNTVNAKPMSTKINTPVENKFKPKLPPIWLVECQECGDFITVNKNKHNGDVFICNNCDTKIPVQEDIIEVTRYSCECGTPHHVSVHSLSNTVSTKCRECGMPIDLRWNDRKEQYDKL